MACLYGPPLGGINPAKTKYFQNCLKGAEKKSAKNINNKHEEINRKTFYHHSENISEIINVNNVIQYILTDIFS